MTKDTIQLDDTLPCSIQRSPPHTAHDPAKRDRGYFYLLELLHCSHKCTAILILKPIADFARLLGSQNPQSVAVQAVTDLHNENC